MNAVRDDDILVRRGMSELDAYDALLDAGFYGGVRIDCERKLAMMRNEVMFRLTMSEDGFVTEWRKYVSGTMVASG